MKKAIALLLALLLLTLAACGDAPTETQEPQTEATETTEVTEPAETAEPAEPQPETETAETVNLPPDFELVDQYGETHRLSDCRGKVVFLNFWATWCTYCIREMPDIQALYETCRERGEDVLVFGVACPGQGKEVDEDGVKAFLEERGWTYPVLMDRDSSVSRMYGASSLPTTFLFAKDGTIFGYVPGAMNAEQMRDAVDQALAAE